MSYGIAEMDTSVAQLFYTLFLTGEGSEKYLEREKLLIGIGYMHLEQDNFEFFIQLMHRTEPSLALEIIKVMYKVVEDGMCALIECQATTDQQWKQYYSLAEWLRTLKTSEAIVRK